MDKRLWTSTTSLLLLSLSTAAKLPSGPLLIGYVDHMADKRGCAHDAIVEAAHDYNVLIWFSVELQSGGSSAAPRPTVASGLDFDCIANVSSTLTRAGLPTVHLASIGGWGATHPNTTWNGTQWVDAFVKWNDEVVARPALGWGGFDGFDWDIEGVDASLNDTADAIFSLNLLHLMGEMSTLARARGGIVFLTACESYLDPAMNLFDFKITHESVEPWPFHFPYHGHNTLSYLLAVYREAFDIVQIMLYESWSRANWQISVVGVPPAAYIEAWARNVIFGWKVDFAYDAYCDIPTQYVNVNASQLVLALANGWANLAPPRPSQNVTKQFRLDVAAVASAYGALQLDGGPMLRGFAVWDIAAEGAIVAQRNGTTAPLYLGRELNEFLHTRNRTQQQIPR